MSPQESSSERNQEHRTKTRHHHPIHPYPARALCCKGLGDCQTVGKLERADTDRKLQTVRTQEGENGSKMINQYGYDNVRIQIENCKPLRYVNGYGS